MVWSSILYASHSKWQNASPTNNLVYNRTKTDAELPRSICQSNHKFQSRTEHQTSVQLPEHAKISPWKIHKPIFINISSGKRKPSKASLSSIIIGGCCWLMHDLMLHCTPREEILRQSILSCSKDVEDSRLGIAALHAHIILAPTVPLPVSSKIISSSFIRKAGAIESGTVYFRASDVICVRLLN